MKNSFLLIAGTLLASISSFAAAHDTWVQSGSLVTRFQDPVHVDLMLGNHGNNHRDFKIASKITLAPCTLEVVAPNGQRTDLKPSIVDNGNAEKEGFWTAKVVADQKGVYQVLHTLDTLHGKTRAIKTAKTFFISSTCFGSIPTTGAERIAPVGKGLELVLDSRLETMGAGKELKMRVLWNGKPLPKARVSFIPRGAKLTEEFDPQYERNSNERGEVTYVPTEGNLILAVVHHLVEDEKGEAFDKTSYGATLVLPVPQIPFAK